MFGQAFQATLPISPKMRLPMPGHERVAWLALIPMLVTMLYYALPRRAQQNVWITFIPQLAGYVCLAVWIARNARAWRRLGLDPKRLLSGIRQGIVIGVILAALNLAFILIAFPALGGEVGYLRETPHARAPLWVMVPFGIPAIGILVELNFRGFQLGRLLTLFGASPRWAAGAVVLSAFVFAWDPFLFSMFRSLHWIALWDGVVWGVLFLRCGTLYATMAAHSVEVCIVYVWLKLWLG